MKKIKQPEHIRWSFKKYAHFGFFIPDKRDQYGWDFYVTKHNDLWALDGQRVIAKELAKSKWKKPEVKIIELLSKDKVNNPEKEIKTVKWVYIESSKDFWFVEVFGKEKWYFCHSSKNMDAQSWQKVKAKIASYNGKEEAIVIEMLEDEPAIMWEFKDNWDFGFVYTKKWQDDIFISPVNYNWAKSWDVVEVRITKIWGRKPEGIIITKKEVT